MTTKRRPSGTNQRAYGTVFASEVKLEGFQATDAPADVEIRFGDVPERLATVAGSGLFWSANPDELLLDAPGIARYHVAGGSRITIEARSEVGARETFLDGIPIGAVLMQRGLTVLHGAAVGLPGGALLFAGLNGAGKSSLVAALAAAGGRPLCDNLAVLELGSGPAVLQPGPASFRLWEDMALALGLDTSAAPRVRTELNKFVFPTEGHPTAASGIRAIVCVEPADADRPSLVPHEPFEATASLMRHHFRAKLARICSRNALAAAGRLAESVPVARLERPVAGCGPRELADFVARALS